MGSVCVVVVSAFFDDGSGMVVAAEDMLVETFVSQPSVEALHKAVLHGLAGRDVVPFNVAVFLPGQHGVGSQFGSVVTDDHTGVTSPFGNGIQLSSHTNTRDRVIDNGGQTFVRKVVDDAQDAEPTTISQSIRDKVQ